MESYRANITETPEQFVYKFAPVEPAIVTRVEWSPESTVSHHEGYYDKGKARMEPSNYDYDHLRYPMDESAERITVIEREIIRENVPLTSPPVSSFGMGPAIPPAPPLPGMAIPTAAAVAAAPTTAAGAPVIPRAPAAAAAAAVPLDMSSRERQARAATTATIADATLNKQATAPATAAPALGTAPAPALRTAPATVPPPPAPPATQRLAAPAAAGAVAGAAAAAAGAAATAASAATTPTATKLTGTHTASKEMGQAKENIGKAAGDPALVHEGKAEKKMGEAQEHAARAQEAARPHAHHSIVGRHLHGHHESAAAATNEIGKPTTRPPVQTTSTAAGDLATPVVPSGKPSKVKGLMKEKFGKMIHNKKMEEEGKALEAAAKASKEEGKAMR